MHWGVLSLWKNLKKLSSKRNYIAYISICHYQWFWGRTCWEQSHRERKTSSTTCWSWVTNSDALPTPCETQMWVPKRKQRKSKKSGARSLAHNTLRGKGVCSSSGMGLGRVGKLHLLTWACTTQHNVVSA